MIQARRQPGDFAEGGLVEQVDGWWKDWMRQVDHLLEDEDLVAIVYEALVRRHPQSRIRGRWGTPAEVVLRMLVLKHVRNWSFEELEWEVRANLVYRQFTRVGGGKVPDAKALGRQAQALGPEAIQKIQERVVGIAVEPDRYGPQTACGYDRGRNQYSSPDRQFPCWAMGSACGRGS